MDPSGGDLRYNLNNSMNNIGLTFSDQSDMYGGNTSTLVALGGRPPSAGLLQSISGDDGPSTSLTSRSSEYQMSNATQCQTQSNSTGCHNTGQQQQRGIKRPASNFYDDSHQRGVKNVAGGGISSLQGLENSSGNVSVQHSSQQQPQSSSSGISDVPQSKKSPPANGKKTKGRVKIKMEYIDNKLRRYTTFSKRKTGIMKKAYELSTLTGTQVMLLVASETGHVYTFATRKLQPMITSEAGKQLIQTCLNSPDPPSIGDGNQRMSVTGFEETELSYNIGDEDSKEIRSPISSVNDSDESSDVEGVGASENFENSLENLKKENENQNHQEYHHAISITKAESKQEDITNQQTNPTPQNRFLNLSETISHLPADLSNVSQGVLLQLIESGHLQVHTEEDGSGHQYVAIPLHPPPVNMMQANKSITNATITKLDDKTENSIYLTAQTYSNLAKQPPIGAIIKQELNE